MALLEEELKEEVYEEEKSNQLCMRVVQKALKRVKEFNYPRYKLVCFFQLGDVKSCPSAISASRCLWNKSTDSFSFSQFSNNSLYALLVVFAVYFE